MPIRSSPPPVTSLTHPHVVAFGSTPIAHADTEVGRTARLATVSPLLYPIFKVAASPPSLFDQGTCVVVARPIRRYALFSALLVQHPSPPRIRKWGEPRCSPPLVPFFIAPSRSRLGLLPFSTKGACVVVIRTIRRYALFSALLVPITGLSRRSPQAPPSFTMFLFVL